MLRTLVFCLLGTVILTNSLAALGDEPAVTNSDTDGFVALDTSKIPTVSGKKLLITAYVVVFSILLLYSFSLYRKEKAINTAAAHLKKQLKP